MWHSLCNRFDIQRVFESSRLERSKGLGIKWKANGSQYNRLVIVAARGKLPKSAIRRNRLRRIGRELYRQIEKSCSTWLQGFDIALIVYPNIEQVRFASSLATLTRMLKNLYKVME